jgi:hypothetical protein
MPLKELNERAIELSHEMYDESTRAEVGAGMTDTIVIDGETFELEVTAFWEKCRHYSFTATSDDQTISYSDEF